MRFSLDHSRSKKDDLGFFLLWLRRPGRVGALLPSGKALANSMAARINRQAPGFVVELGGGTGSITQAILAAGVAPTELVVVEREAKLCAVLAERFPQVRILRGDAQNLEALLKDAKIGPVKAIVSGLPLLTVANSERRRILAAAFAVLSPGGELLQFTYGPNSPVPREIRQGLGLVGERSDWVLYNLPPAFIWRYRRKTPAIAQQAGSMHTPVRDANAPASPS